MATNLNIKEGIPITRELAVDLRSLMFGTAAAPPRGEWTRTGIVFNPPSQELAYGLRGQRNGTRGVLSVLQGFILKFFLFDKRFHEKVRTNEQLLRPNEQQQIDALVTSMTEILSIIAGKTKIVIVLPGEEEMIPHSISYFQDSVTEKLLLYEMKRPEQAQVFIKRNINYFMEDAGSGVLLFLYSAVLTRTIVKVRTDMDCPRATYFVGPSEEGSINVVTLLLTGRATPYLHNGVVHVGDEEHYALPQYGVLSRTLIGFLVWESDKGKVNPIRQPGSRLRTPNLPIWVTYCAGHYGVAFNSNQELLRNYHAESRFDLLYYSCSGNQISMTIDNKYQNERANFMLQRQSSVVVAPPTIDKDEGAVATSLERLIRTKWEEANIRIHAQPSSLSYLFNTVN